MSDEVITEKTPLLIVAGPTATGKSDSAVELALRMNGEVISADSMQVYRGMDIGSAKITREEMRGVPHHLIDCADPDENWNVVRFQKEARNAVQDIISRGRLPILCGGTGFYIQALLYDIDFTQMEENTPLRERLSAMAAEKGPEAVHKLLAERDPASAAAIHPNNIKRVIRALEFMEESGSSIASHNMQQRERESYYRSVFFVLTMERARLYERIDRRVDLMMERGLVEEVSRLRDMGIRRDSTSMQGIGYKQIYGCLEGEYDLDEAVRLVKRDTRHFAKRQLTWFRREKDVIWTDLDRFSDRRQLWDHMQTTAENIIHNKGD
jgi:tRNA dimethylallyltransferase